MDPENHLGLRERTEGEQGCFVGQKEGNLEDAQPAHRPLPPAHRNLPVKNQDLDLSHRPRPSKRHRCLDEMPECERFRLAKTNPSLLENLTGHLCRGNHRLGTDLLLRVLRCQRKIVYYPIDGQMLYYPGSGYEYVLWWSPCRARWYRKNLDCQGPWQRAWNLCRCY